MKYMPIKSAITIDDVDKLDIRVGEIVGLQALFIVNLPARKMAGEVSEGMLFDIGYVKGVTPVLATPDKPVPNGVSAG